MCGSRLGPLHFARLLAGEGSWTNSINSWTNLEYPEVALKLALAQVCGIVAASDFDHPICSIGQ